MAEAAGLAGRRFTGTQEAAVALPATRGQEETWLRPAEAGAAAGGVRLLLRLEGLALLAAALAGYAQFGAGWGLFAALFLLPDFSLLAYLAGPRRGAQVYNAAHATLGPLALIAGGVLGDAAPALSLGLIWLAHIGVDRALGFGLKYADGFGRTHLGRLGPADPW